MKIGMKIKRIGISTKNVGETIGTSQARIREYGHGGEDWKPRQDTKAED